MKSLLCRRIWLQYNELTGHVEIDATLACGGQQVTDSIRRDIMTAPTHNMQQIAQVQGKSVQENGQPREVGR
jgi:hypothetical protein